MKKNWWAQRCYDVAMNNSVSTIQSTSNLAFIDGQNLYSGTRDGGWAIDHLKFRTYLLEKYNVQEAYYFLGVVSDKEQGLYDRLQKAGFILSFREHSMGQRAHKKGNVDSDIIFNVMKKLVANEVTGKVFIVSGDGDYKKMVEFLIEKECFGKMLFPNGRYASSLFFSLGTEYYDYLDGEDVKAKIIYSHK